MTEQSQLHMMPVHSRAEATLYIRVTPCPICRTGAMVEDPPRDNTSSATGEVDEGASDAAAPGFFITTQCSHCREGHTFHFAPDTDLTSPSTSMNVPWRINPTTAPSRIIDVGQWLTLFKIILQAASETTDKGESRRLGFEAAQCLEEALKFYEDDNELPPSSACFTGSTRKRMQDRPDLFARQRLIDMRAKLPTLAKMEVHLAADSRRVKTRRRLWRRR